MDALTLFTSLAPDQVALGAIVTFCVLSLIMGWIIPRKIHRERMDDKDKQINNLVTERDSWRSAYQTAESARLVASDQASDLLDGAKTTNHLIESLRNNLERMNPVAYSQVPAKKEIEN